MPEWWTIAALIAVLILAAIISPLVGFVLRRRWLSRHGWVIECSIRRPERTPTGGWMLGIARIENDQLLWYRAFSLASTPAVVFQQGHAQIFETRAATQAEEVHLYDQNRIAIVHTDTVKVEIAMSSVDMTALLSWLEAAPPGREYGSLG